MIEMSGICRLKIGLHPLHLQSRVCSPAISGVEISVRISHYKSSSHEEKPPGTSGTSMAQKDILCRKSASQKHLAPAAQVPPRALPQLTLNVSHFVTFGSVMLGVNAPPAKVLISVSNKTSNIITGTAIAIPQYILCNSFSG